VPVDLPAGDAGDAAVLSSVQAARHDGAAPLKAWPLACPADRAPLVRQAEGLHCPSCGTSYPIVGGVPVLIDDQSSVFAVADYVGGRSYGGVSYGQSTDGRQRMRSFWRRWMMWLRNAPSNIHHPGPEQAIRYVERLKSRPRTLVIGCGAVRVGGPDDDVVHTDVAFGPFTDAIADAHALPFPNGNFDLVVAVAVLEHVADPQRCVSEMRRVLSPQGHVFAVTPFMQPVHMGAHDFTRFTPIGHRRLFRHFDEVAAGISTGMGSVLADVSLHALLALSAAPAWRRMAKAAAYLANPMLRKLDRWMPRAGDAPGGCWFFGRLRDGPPVSDRSLVQSYRQTFGLGLVALPDPVGASPRGAAIQQPSRHA
jgi:SAM-dependent methyltransferase